MHAEGHLAAPGAGAGGSVGLAALRSPGAVVGPVQVFPRASGSRAEDPPSLGSSCRLPGTLDSSFGTAGVNGKYFSYLNLLLEIVQRAVILKLKGATKGSV